MPEFYCTISNGLTYRLFATPWTVAPQAPSMGFSREEYWSGLPFPSPGDLPDPLYLGPTLNQHQFSSVAQSCPTLQPHGLQHARPLSITNSQSLLEQMDISPLSQ